MVRRRPGTADRHPVRRAPLIYREADWSGGTPGLVFLLHYPWACR